MVGGEDDRDPVPQHAQLGLAQAHWPDGGDTARTVVDQQQECECVTNNDIVDQIAAETGISKVEGKKIVAAVFDAIAQAAVRGDEVAIGNFGKFKVKDTPAREGRNPATGEAMTIKASRKLTFAPGKAIKDRLNG